MKVKHSAKFALAAFLLAALLGSSYVLAEGRFHRSHGLGMRHFAPELQLTEDQRAQIKEILANSREIIHPLYSELKEKRRLFREAAGAEPFDEALTRFHAQQLAGVQAEVMFARAQAFNEVLSVLTPDQKAKLEELRTERRGYFGEQRGRRFRRPHTEN